MFGFESELLVLLIVALIVVGPKDLPRLLRIAGQWVGKARAMADQFRASFDEMARDTELDELRKELSALRTNNPVTRFTEEINRSIQPPGAPALGKMMLGEVPETTTVTSPPSTAPEAAAPAAPETAMATDIHAEPEPPVPGNHQAPLPPGFTPAGP